MVANFPNGVFGVTLYRKSGGVWIAVGTDESSAAGNAYFSNYVVKGGEQLFAQKANGDTTEADTLTPTIIDPANFPETGTISIDPATKVYDGRSGTVARELPATASSTSPVYTKDGDEWIPVGHARDQLVRRRVRQGRQVRRPAGVLRRWLTPASAPR